MLTMIFKRCLHLLGDYGNFEQLFCLNSDKKEKNKNKRGKDQNKLWDETNMQKFPYVHGVRVSDKVGFLG